MAKHKPAPPVWLMTRVDASQPGWEDLLATAVASKAIDVVWISWPTGTVSLANAIRSAVGAETRRILQTPEGIRITRAVENARRRARRRALRAAGYSAAAE